MRYLLLGLTALALIGAAFGVTGRDNSVPNLSTIDNFKNTCESWGHHELEPKSNRQRQAFAICRDVELVKNIVSFAMKYKGSVGTMPKDSELRKIIRDQLTHIRDELRASRTALEGINLAPGEGLEIIPSTWQVDLNGDRNLEIWEKYFFAIPRKQHDALRFQMPSEDEDYYKREYDLDAVIRVDQSDIAWALSYHYFVESFVETILAYTLNRQSIDETFIELVDPSGMKRANDLMIKGLQTSDLTRKLVEAETDDGSEWIANERQLKTVFPISLEKSDFETWALIMEHLIPLFQGKTLLLVDHQVNGLLGAIARSCPSGQGLNVAKFYENPPRYPAQMFFRPDWSHFCQVVDADHPTSGLANFLEHYADRAAVDDGAGMGFLKRLLWVN